MIDRIAQDSGLVLIFFVAAAVLAVPVVIWRIRAGRSSWSALWITALEAGLVASLIGILALTLSAFAVAGQGAIDLIPFRGLVDSFALGEFWVGIALFDLVGNVLLYMPLGFFAALRFERLSGWVWLGIALVLSGAIEVTQFLLLNRAADVTDVLMNTLGAVTGFLVGRAIQHAGRRIPIWRAKDRGHLGQ